MDALVEGVFFRTSNDNLNYAVLSKMVGTVACVLHAKTQ
jgi:hypothetical protein